MNIPLSNLSSETFFRTDRLPLASFIHATERLHFVRTELNGNRAVFVFEDQQKAAPRIELAYERGATCPATALFASQKFLRREIDKIRDTELRQNDRSRHGR